jgi:hypothetical protein
MVSKFYSLVIHYIYVCNFASDVPATKMHGMFMRTWAN